MTKYVTIKTITEEKLLLKKEDFKIHGQWGEMNRHIATMYTHIPTGTIFYAECKEAIERKLHIYPFKEE
jgi:hypothetical protein|tara:strand:+ start:1077 stop:1283 length:207 start_codon:yes stop_codon:yes gene_type:complete